MYNTTRVYIKNENNEESSCPLKEASSMINNFILPLISAFGIVINLFGSLVFFQMIKKIKIECHMFKYLMVKSIDDTLRFICQIFSPLYYCENCNLQNSSYAGVLWYIWFYYYNECALEFCSSWMEVLATLDFYCLIKKKMKILHQKQFLVCILIIFHAYGFIFYIIFVYNFEIIEILQKHATNGTLKYFEIKKSEFYYSIKGVVTRVIHTFQRDMAVMFILIFLNVLILNEYYRNRKRKIKLLSNSIKNRAVLNAERAIKNQRAMIYLVNLNHFFGHIGILVYYIPFLNNSFWNCVHLFSFIPFSLSYTTNIILFYFFNNHFKNLTRQNFHSIFATRLFFKKKFFLFCNKFNSKISK
jgi:hypothetical protein